MKRLRTDDIAVQIEACRQLCDQLAEGENAPFGAIIAAGALPLLIQLVERVDAPALQYVAVRCITNLVTGGTVHTRAVVDDGELGAARRHVERAHGRRVLDERDGERIVDEELEDLWREEVVEVEVEVVVVVEEHLKWCSVALVVQNCPWMSLVVS